MALSDETVINLLAENDRQINERFIRRDEMIQTEIISGVNDHTDTKSTEIIDAINNIDIDTSALVQEILEGVEDIVHPGGHIYPDVGLLPDFLTSVLNPSSYADPDIIYAIEHMDTRMIQNFKQMFSLSQYGMVVIWGDINLELDLRNWNMSNAKILRQMFYHAYFKRLNLSGWDVRNVQDMSYMFNNLGNDINKVDIIDLSTWDLSYLKKHDHMFYCTYANGLLWGGALNAPVGSDYHNTSLCLNYFYGMNFASAEAFFNSLSPKTASHEVIIEMPSSTYGADISIATNKGYTIKYY